MTTVDPFIAPLPPKIQNDPELRPFFEYLVRWAHDMWIRSGGPVDSVDEVSDVQAEQAPRRSTSSEVRAELDLIWSHIGERKRDSIREEVSQLYDEIATLKRHNSALRSQLAETQDSISQVNRRHRSVDDRLNEIMEYINATESINSAKINMVMQELHELIARYDGGG